VIDNY